MPDKLSYITDKPKKIINFLFLWVVFVI